jgi:hypothetical protein
MFAFFAVVAIALAVLAYQHSKVRRAAREAHIRSFVLPQGLFAELKKKRPDLTQKDCELVAHALRQFFFGVSLGRPAVRFDALAGGRRFVARVHLAHPHLRTVLPASVRWSVAPLARHDVERHAEV